MLHAACQLCFALISMIRLLATVDHNRFITTNDSEFAVIFISSPFSWEFFHMMFL